MTRVFQQDVLQWCKEYEGEKFHALLCDPPYHLSGGFMGKKWDKDGPDAIAFNPKTWGALAEHLLPGAFGMAFASSRGWHRMACAIEDAGLIIHPSIFGWSFGSGFPKATRIDTQVDRKNGHIIPINNKISDNRSMTGGNYERTKTWEAKTWEGHRYGLQALKPAIEPIIVFQKPYVGKPLDSITKTGAGALNIDGGRIGTKTETHANKSAQKSPRIGAGNNKLGGYTKDLETEIHNYGRWPANFLLVHTPECKCVGSKVALSKNGTRGTFKDAALAQQGAEYVLKEIGQNIGYADANGKEPIADWECVSKCPVRRLGEQSGESTSTGKLINNKRGVLKYDGQNSRPSHDDSIIKRSGGFFDTGTAARFFFNADWNAEVEERLFEADPVRYQAKASRRERDAGVGGVGGVGALRDGGRSAEVKNHHPTVKPLKLTEHLAKLLLPPIVYAPRRVLIPFSGSGSEMIGAHKAGWEEIIGIEQDTEYVKIAEARIAHYCKIKQQHADLFYENAG